MNVWAHKVGQDKIHCLLPRNCCTKVIFSLKSSITSTSKLNVKLFKKLSLMCALTWKSGRWYSTSALALAQSRHKAVCIQLFVTSLQPLCSACTVLISIKSTLGGIWPLHCFPLRLHQDTPYHPNWRWQNCSE